MARRKNQRPTLIYWLIDTRPETLLAGWPNGLPFYCGKTVLGIQARFIIHKSDVRMGSTVPVANRLRECGEFVRYQLMETVAATEDWCDREKRWIWVCRAHFPGCVNVTSGGQGAPGYIHTEATKAKISAKKKGKPKSPEHRAKLSAANKGKIASIETREKMRIRMTGTKQSAESRAKTSKARMGMKFSASHRANMSAVRKGKKLTPDHAAKCRRTLIPKRVKQEDAQCPPMFLPSKSPLLSSELKEI